VWDELREELDLNLQQLRQQLTIARCLHQEMGERNPGATQIMAWAAILHSFYTGVENLFKRVSVKMDGDIPKGENWHILLLNNMIHSTQNRPALITEALKEKLKKYMDFRHVFRHAYTYDLQWNKMAPLVLDLGDVFNQLEQEVNEFISKILI